MEEHTARPQRLPFPERPPAVSGKLPSSTVSLGRGKTTTAAPGHGAGSQSGGQGGNPNK